MSYLYKDSKGEHLHELDGKPLIGTSTVCKIIGKGDALTWWAAGMACEKLGWKNPKKFSSLECELEAARGWDKIREMSYEDYQKYLQEAYSAHDTYKKERAKIGTARHEELEMYVKSCLQDGGWVEPYIAENEYVKKFAEWAEENVKKFLWSEVNCYSETLWVGGIADFGYYDKKDRVIAGDFKSGKEVYLDQWIQVAGYDLQITENGGFDAEGKLIFTLEGEPIVGYCIVPFGADKFDPALTYEVESFKEGFKNTLSLYKLSQSLITSK